MENIKFSKKLFVFIKRNGRIVIGSLLIACVLFVAIFAPLLTEYDPGTTSVYNKNQPASPEHPLGTDPYGRDMWSLIAYGARASLIVAVSTQVLTVVFGALLGLVCGFYPKVDMVVMRILEAIGSLPTILVVFVISAVLGNGYINLILAMMVEGLNSITRYTRMQVMSLRQKEFVEREIAMGAGTFRTMILHVLPQCSSYLLVTFGAGLGGKVMSLATLSYLGVGLPAEVPNWGAQVSSAQTVLLYYPQQVFYPMIAIAITTFGFCMLGEGLRDLLDPKTR